MKARRANIPRMKAFHLAAILGLLMLAVPAEAQNRGNNKKKNQEFSHFLITDVKGISIPVGNMAFIPNGRKEQATEIIGEFDGVNVIIPLNSIVHVRRRDELYPKYPWEVLFKSKRQVRLASIQEGEFVGEVEIDDKLKGNYRKTIQEIVAVEATDKRFIQDTYKPDLP